MIKIWRWVIKMGKNPKHSSNKNLAHKTVRNAPTTLVGDTEDQIKQDADVKLNGIISNLLLYLVRNKMKGRYHDGANFMLIKKARIHNAEGFGLSCIFDARVVKLEHLGMQGSKHLTRFKDPFRYYEINAGTSASVPEADINKNLCELIIENLKTEIDGLFENIELAGCDLAPNNNNNKHQILEYLDDLKKHWRLE